MKNMGCKNLRIIGDKSEFSDHQVRTLAVHAADIWENALFFPPSIIGLTQALSDCTIAAGTTRRMGQKRKSWGMTPEQFAVFGSQSGDSKKAVVFGNERTGLTDEELGCCTLAVNIPTSDTFPSLNLSHAVQIMTYTLFRAYDTKHRGYEPIQLSRLEDITQSISENLTRIGLYKTSGKVDNDEFLQGVFSRAALSEGEAKRLKDLFQKITYIKTQCVQDK